MQSHAFPLLLTLLPALSGSLRAQTFEVDAAGGPGVAFTSIAAAVAAVPDGAVLVVRAGSYGGFTIQGKGLAILADPGVMVQDPVAVQNTSAVQRVLLRGLTWPTVTNALPGTTPPAVLSAANCAGLLVLEELNSSILCQNSGSGCTPLPALAATSCAQLTIRTCSLGATRLAGSHATIEQSSLRGLTALFLGTAGSTPGLDIAGGTTQLVDTSLTGGSGWNLGHGTTVPGARAMTMRDADVRLLSGSITSGAYATGATILASGASRLRIDPGMSIGGAPQVGGVIPSTAAMPSVVSSSAAPGGTLAAVGDAPIGHVMVLLVGLPGPRNVLPIAADPVWIDPGAFEFLAVGVSTAGLRLAGHVPVPSLPALRGASLAWQVVALDPASGTLEAGNPSISTVHGD